MAGIFKVVVAILLFGLLDEIAGHGMMMDPVNRASRWRLDKSAPIDYNDMEGFCGGYGVMWGTNGGKCGLCGDPYHNPKPRTHELGGKFGQGTIVKTYKQGTVINVTIRITANHLGYFYFNLCKLDSEVESDACFDRIKVLTSAGSETWPIPTGAKDYIIALQLPKITCNHCVLRWTYVAGNNWGYCGDGTGKLGCGPQEHFRSCSDIKITS